MSRKRLKFIENVKKAKFSALFGVYLFVVAFLLGILTQQYIGKNNLNFSINGLRLGFSQAKVEQNLDSNKIDLNKLQEEVLPSKGYVFQIKWGNLGKKLVEDGVIDEVKLTKALTGGDTLPEEYKKYLDGSDQPQIELNASNAQFWVDVLWGLGLANKNEILEKGPMVEGGNIANFASTGGWTIGKKGPMEVYSKYQYISLTPEQQTVVKEIADGVYRPCCGNSTAFPDCNHGMAALALIELMVSQGFSKEEIYKTVLAFNSYWFPQTYLDISYHFAKNGKDWKQVPASEILSKTFSSAMGYQVIKKQVGEVSWPALQRFGGCGA